MKNRQLPLSTVARFREGDAGAFSEVLRMYAPRVRAIARRYLESPFHQEEAMQEVWVHAFRRRDALDPERLDEIDGWLLTLARRKCIDYARSLGRHASETSLPAEQESGARPLDHAEQQELREAAETFKERLEPEWREFFALHFVQGLDYAEVAARLSISRLRCKYMKKVIAARARRFRPLLDALGREQPGGSRAP